MNTETLGSLLSAYLSIRQTVGFKDVPHQRLLADFLQYCAKQQISDLTLGQSAVDWARSTSRPDARASQARRLQIARGFLAYVKTVLPETEVPPVGLLGKQRCRRPFVFSRDEIVTLLDAAATLKPRGTLRPHTYRTIIGLLACTGLRASEVVKLKVSDVQLCENPPRLHIFETKFHKSRWVPLHLTTADALARYKERRSESRLVASADPFFISNLGNPIPYHTLKNTFTRLVHRLGITAASQERGPSLHSLRHYFAVQRLTVWSQQRADVTALAPRLSIYLGHGRLSDSYCYLSAMPDLLKAAADCFYLYVGKEGGHD